MSDLLTKSDVLRLKGWSYEFFNALHVPAHHIGKRDYFTLEDVDLAILAREKLVLLRIKLNAAFPKSDFKLVAREIKPYKHSAKFRKKYPLKYKAHLLVKSAISSGKLKIKPCEICGSETKVQAHHDDYRKPLDVRWLCQKDHLKWHRNNKAKYELSWENL